MTLEDRLRTMLDRISHRDQDLAAELAGMRRRDEVEETARRMQPILESMAEGGAPPRVEMVLETIVLRTGRPVLAVSHDEPRLEFNDADSEIWRDRLTTARRRLVPAIRGVGRVEIERHPSLDWVGTGWLVRPDVVLTNRHVAAEFGRRGSEGFVFRAGTGGRKMNASVDFLEELDREESTAFRVRSILHIEDDDGPDLAFLRVEGQGLAEPITLSRERPKAGSFVAVIGYPARDSRIPDQKLMEQIFGDVYDKKRLAPGQVGANGADRLLHDCSTLGGNSGSLVLDLNSGQAVGAHFAGRFLETNFAVPSTLIAERLERLERTGWGLRPNTRPAAHVHTTTDAPTDDDGPPGPRLVTLTFPVRVTVEVDPPRAGAAAPPPRARPDDAPAREGDGQEDEVLVTEAVPEDYSDRQGYEPRFLGPKLDVPLPRIVRDAADLLEFEINGKKERVLKYEHFSVLMSRRRRMCFLSASNIDGRQSRRMKRTGWRVDPRIPKSVQIVKECYGNPPRFARGHMTRREDPVWGSVKAASRGNDDSMHVSNAVPQMQPFNAGIWLGLEDYALEHARQDDMRICVITGPVLAASDPVRFGVKIPVEFWKVIAFIHDRTRRLCATGYSMSQKGFLQEEEFVFGRHETYQRSLAWIEQKAGVSFGKLASRDPLRDEEEAVPVPLADFAQIRFS